MAGTLTTLYCCKTPAFNRRTFYGNVMLAWERTSLERVVCRRLDANAYHRRWITKFKKLKAVSQVNTMSRYSKCCMGVLWTKQNNITIFHAWQIDFSPHFGAAAGSQKSPLPIDKTHRFAYRPIQQLVATAQAVIWMHAKTLFKSSNSDNYRNE